MEFASKCVERAIDVVLDLTVRHVGYIISYRENNSELNSLVEDLRLERERVEHGVGEAKNNLRTIEGDVRDWLQKVNETRTKTEEFQNDEGHAKTRCSSGLLPYLRNRHRLGRKAKKMVADVKLLIDKSKFDGVSYQQNPTSMDAALSNAGYVEFGSRKDTMEKIMGKLEDSTVRMIGVHGPGGVGKSTLIKEIARKAEDKKLFDVVVKVDITDNPNLQKIQEEIAYRLGLRLEGEGETVRADRLRRRLKEETESTLVILDDLWDRIDLNKIGIPFDDDNDDELSHMTIRDIKDPNLKMVKKGKSFGDYKRGIPSSDDNDDDLCHMTMKDIKDPDFKMVKKEKSLGDYKGCKILLTSRDRKVLSDKMNVKSIIYVRELDDKDALMLFKKVAGTPEVKSKFKQEIVKKYCAGLPMAIVTVGRALRDTSESVWEATLEKLKKEELIGVQKSMEISVKMSYDHLASEELKSIFLLCAQMGHQQLIMDLVKYCFGLGILEGVYTLKEARDRIYTSIQRLKDSSLMLDGSSSDRFNIHDMVRDAALSIAHKEQHVFALRNGKLDDWPDKDELESCTAISICNSDIIDDLPKVINCPQLKFFQIDSDDPSLKIPENFFEGMEKLRVLILTGFHLACLPSSIKCLLNLRMLCLQRCVLVDNLSIIGELKKLRILSFSGSQIENLPAELGCLDKLQLFDISDCSIMKMVPPNFISRLTCLEELYIRKSLTKMEVDGGTNQSQISFLSVLKYLHQLRVLDLYISDGAVLPRDLFFDRLNDYKIVIGDFKMLLVGDFRMPNKYEALRSLALQMTDGTDIHSQKGIKLLFKRVENLLLGELNGVQDAFYELNLDGFPDLKHLSIINNISIEYIVNSKELSDPQNAFPNLESLCLYKLRNIKMICYTLVTDASFTKLKTIKVQMCILLKNLFSFYMVECLSSLETIDVSECDSLEEIVVKEGQTNSSKVEFHKLRSLTLQSLPSFTSFYTNVEMPSVDGQTTNRDHIEITIAEGEQSVMVPPSPFGELVEIPNLESLKLSSINSHMIWSDRPQSSFCFQNLIKLTVKDCHNLRYLCSLSVASSLKKLKSLFISDCRMMKKIFSTEGNNVEKVCIFPKLEDIHLTNLNMLTDIWQAEVGGDSFSSLISVQITGCQMLDKVFPSHMTGWFGSLDSLKVVNCKSVEVIFEMKDSQQIDASRKDTKLQFIHVLHLPNLKQVWDRDPGGILNFKNLRSIEVINCGTLSSVFPASVSKDLERLEHISVSQCNKMEEIVAWENGLETPLEFPEVTSIKLSGLSNITRFYMGGHIECPKLKLLVVHDCEKLETFTTETTNEERQPLFLDKKVISNLEMMSIGSVEAEWLRRNYGKYRMHRLKALALHSLDSIELLYWFLHRTPNLESLVLISSQPMLTELVPSGNIAPLGRLGAVLQLKALTLVSSATKDLGFERDPVLQRLEHLTLRGCGNLINLAPSSVSFIHLTYLEVGSCRRLINLMASSTVKSMVQLATMKVIQCDKVKEIVTNEGNEEEDGVIEVVFSKLISIELVRLKNLTSFCSYKKCEFKFPSLERLIVRECLMLETFTESHITAPKLQNILVEEKRYWEGDLNVTIQKAFQDKVFFEYTKYLDLSYYPKLLEQVWHRNDLVQENIFHNLKTLKIWSVSNLVHVIPSHLLPCFENLEELQVQNCKAVKVIFNINDMRLTKALGTFRLKRLFLCDLRKLEHIWDKDPEGIFGLQVLQTITVYSCWTLKNLFPASVAKDLTRLEVLSVTNCTELVEIFSKDGIATKGAAKEFVFPCLTSLNLKELPRLKYFYPGLHQLEWPMLKALTTYHCGLVVLKCQENHPKEKAHIQIDEKVISNLEFMDIGSKEAVWLRRNYGNCRMHRLKALTLHSLDSIELLYWFLHSMPNLESLVLISSHPMLTELVPSGNIAPQGRLGTVLQLKSLTLWQSEIRDLGFERDPVLQRLEHLVLYACGNLINLAPCSVSFIHLTYLEVKSCRRLINIMASSTAKSMVQLATMKVIQCQQVEEVVTNEGNEEEGGIEVVFSKLISIELVTLKNLTSFCSHKNCEFKFPSLERLIVRECPMLETFTESHITAPKLQNILVEEKKYWEGDLNVTIQKAFQDKVFLEYTKYLDLSYYPKLLEQVWHRNDLVQENIFRNLKTLKIWSVSNLVHVIPSHLLPCFENLEELQVRHCKAVQVIFNMNDMRVTKSLGTFRLKRLFLYGLPKLEHIWDKDPEGIFGLQVLQEMRVDRCDTLKNLFPVSVAKDLTRLELLSVTNCTELVEIFSKHEIATKGAAKEFVFPCLTSLDLKELPRLKYFYPGLHKLEWPMLKVLTTYHCNLVVHKCQEDHPEEQALIQIEKVIQIPSLEILSFGIGDTMVTWNRGFRKLHIKLQRFQEESDSVLYRYLIMLPNIERLELSKGLLEEMFSTERPNVDYTRALLHLKELELTSLDSLNFIGIEHSWLHPILENLQTLKVQYCDRLINLVPRMVSFSNLTYLEVHGCEKLIYLFTSSTVKNLCQLKEMTIEWCESMQEIVSTEGDESHEDENIIFGQLHTLCLKDLEQLRCFYLGNFTLCFPSLEKVYVIKCKWMKTFSPINRIDPTKLSFGVTFSKDATPQWEGDLNSTVRKRFEEKSSKSAANLSTVRLRDSPLQEIWQGSLPVPDKCFSNLKDLIVDGCQFLSEVLPSNLLPFLTSLKKLEVRNCSFVRTIFDVKCITEDRKMTTMGPSLLPLPFSLKILKLEQLPNLENVWNENPHEILRTQVLKEVYVDKCKCLTSLFPASVAKDLVKLENLQVKHCEELMVIVEEDNADPKGTVLELRFPRVMSLALLELPKLKNFYHSLHCDMLKISTHPQPHTEDEVVCIEKLTPSLRRLSVSLGDKELRMIWQGNLLHKLKVLVLLCFDTKSHVFPYGFLQQVPNIEKLVVRSSSFKEIFCFQRPDVVCTELLSRLKLLKFESLSELICIGLEHSWIEPFLRNLEILKVIRCVRLRNLVASPACFSNLMHLFVLKCHGLVNLFTSSTAKSLGRLKKMEIGCCKSMQEIVSTEGDELHEDKKIIFEQLEALYLRDLQQLKCFYSGNFTVAFPSLEQVLVINCHKMETFCPSIVNADRLRGVQFKDYSDAIPLEMDLNSTIRKAFLAMAESNSNNEEGSDDDKEVTNDDGDDGEETDKTDDDEEVTNADDDEEETYETDYYEEETDDEDS